jgi:hypothetical protein
MNERNQELIVDLIGGRLSLDEERAAFARIENDPDFRAEYETQISAISMLEASSTPLMTPDERSTLHAVLRQQLHLDDTPVPIVAVTSRWQRWWAPLGGLAVAAAVVVGAVVILPGVLSSSDSDGSFETASAEIATTAPNASLGDGLAEESEDHSGGADAAAPQATESAVAGGSTADEDVPSTTTAAAYDAAEAPTALPYLSDVNLEALERELASDPESLRNGISTPSSKSSELDPSQVEACLDSLRADDTASSFSPIATTTYEGTESVVVSVSPPEGAPFLVVFAGASCRELASTQG